VGFERREKAETANLFFGAKVGPIAENDLPANVIFSTKRQERGYFDRQKTTINKRISWENDQKPKGLPFFREPSYGVHAPKPFSFSDLVRYLRRTS
jgi:hypothetical protein